jgi:hypothetical protein
MRKILEVEKLKDLRGRPLQGQKLTVDGTGVFRRAGAETEITTAELERILDQPETERPGIYGVLVDLDTEDAIERLILNTPGTAQKPADGARKAQVFAAFARRSDSDGSALILHHKAYEWLLLLADRKVPIESDAERAGVAQRTVSQSVFGHNEFLVRLAIRTEDDRDELRRTEDGEDSDVEAGED